MSRVVKELTPPSRLYSVGFAIAVALPSDVALAAMTEPRAADPYIAPDAMYGQPAGGFEPRS